MRRERKKKKWLKWLLIGVTILLLSIGAYIFTVYQSLNTATEKMHEPIEREASKKRTEQVKFNEQDPFSVLMLGVDERDDDQGRSDTMIVMTVNPKEETTKLLSIPRDTMTEIVGKGIDDKINHAYAFGGIPMAMDTVENFLDIPIDYYVQVNMEGFEDIVDAVGGVTVSNSFAFDYDGYSFPEGELTLDGQKALSFSRMRYEDPDGDFGRQERQRQIIQGVVREGASINSLWNYGNIFNALGNNIKTNLTFDEMVDIQSEYRAAASNFEQTSIQNGYGERINNVYYYIVPDNEIQSIQASLKDHLDI
ncbi:polyisoprenyl-teichoic acid--peptidoglycan teichoic acid transferase TagU [Jeotgalibacillus campisalis]|uniref:Polyisoprenyl-teichoic acid--peptidoglycan teichoic acid transferase TagU n=1 Tax=Jeotgalibacillus campisalis TaxID=220754 RepID=A0A0C2RMQ4_9BACL|nr:LytR family transcriptional regulator [Jeotgalibacillus campisalis]KIL43029.1 transcriptional regulator [Jeotgalibacillus campisalis]